MCEHLVLKVKVALSDNKLVRGRVFTINGTGPFRTRPHRPMDQSG